MKYFCGDGSMICFDDCSAYCLGSKTDSFVESSSSSCESIILTEVSPHFFTFLLDPFRTAAIGGVATKTCFYSICMLFRGFITRCDNRMPPAVPPPRAQATDTSGHAGVRKFEDFARSAHASVRGVWWGYDFFRETI